MDQVIISPSVDVYLFVKKTAAANEKARNAKT